MKTHEITALVNQVRDIAIEFHGAQQLRDRIANLLVPVLTPSAPAVDAGARYETLVNALMLEAEKFWWNDGPSGKSADAMNTAKRALILHIDHLEQELETTKEQLAESDATIDQYKADLAALSASTESAAGEQFEHLDVQNHSYRRTMQKIMARLTSLLDEDHFAEIETFVKQMGVEPSAISDQKLTDEQRTTIQKSVDTAHRILIAGGDYGDDLSDIGLRNDLKASRDSLLALLGASGEA